jgi:acyl-CoA synthetase (AMP-forming)/AMP-acid ligase II
MSTFTVAPRTEVHPSRLDFTLGPRARPVPAKSLAELVRRLADRHPDRPLFHVLNMRGETTTLTAAELAERAGALARGLRQAGVGRGGAVLLAMETSPDLLVSFFGCGLAGAVPCLVGLPTTAAQRLAWVEKVRGCLGVIGAAAVIAESGWAEVARQATDRQQVHTPAALEQEGRAAPALDVAPHELAFLQFTSGTTARQKAIAISQQALAGNAAGLAHTAEWSEGDLMVGWLPLHHDMGLVATTLAALLHGLPTVLMPPAAFMLRPARWFWAIHAFRGTQSFAPNFAYQFTATRVPDRDLEGLSLASWRRAYNAAEFIHESTTELFCSRFERYGFDRDALYPAYGLAENTVGATCRSPDDALTFDTISRSVLAEERVAVPLDAEGTGPGPADRLAVACVGRPFPGTELRIADAAGRPLRERREGRILLRGRSLFSGYLGDTEATRAVFHDGWFDTGDLGYLVEGRLYVTGRTKDLIIKAGQNISPYAIEHAVSAVDGVRTGCVAALAVPNEETGTEDVVVVFETARRDPAALEALQAEIEERVRAATGIAADRVIPVPSHSIPKTTSGKTRRPELRQMIEAGTLPAVEAVLAQSTEAR